MSKVKINTEILEGLEAVRESGLTNMFDRQAAIEIAHDLDYSDTAYWIEDNPKEYHRGIFVGFETEEER